MNFMNHIIDWHGAEGMLNHMNWFGFGGVIMWILILIAIAIVIYLFAKNPSRSVISANRESALEILRKRYASGEISKDEFERMRTELH